MKLKITNKLRYNPYLYKNIFKLLSLSLFLSNFSMYPSIANSNTEIDNRYEELEGEYITIDDYVDNKIKDIEILGNTVQNEDDLSDIKSVGDKVDGLDLYKIPILSTGKNLLNIPKHFEKDMQWKIYNVSYLIDYVKLKPNTDYTFTAKYTKSIDEVGHGGIGLYLLDSIPQAKDMWYVTQTPNESLYVQEAPNQTINKSFNSGEYKYFAVYLGVATGNTHNHIATLDNAQLEEGVQATEYEPYQEDKLTILSPTPLEKVGNVRDRIICKDGVWGVEKNIDNVVIDGTENWWTYIHPTQIGTNTIPFSLEHPASVRGSDVITSSFIQKGVYNTDVECVEKDSNTDWIIVRILKSRLATEDLDGFKVWLQANPTTVKYVSTQPQFIPLPNSQQLKLRTFVNKTHIFSQTENGVNPTIKVKIDRVIRLASIAVKQAENAPTIENLTIARNLVNQMSESELKNEFQQRLNNLSINYGLPTEDIISTSNVDVYIKYENMISMALSTNSVSFEDCSLVADTEKNNAISISINSSLPYQLNSYLVTEIQNNDKSSTLDIDVLSIKDSSEVDYKNFPDINEKLILKDNCDSGNDKRHNIDLKVKANDGYKADIYKAVIKFEARQK